ncbi:MAG: DUF4209 domain-containing protein [Lysobacter sp.]
MARLAGDADVPWLSARLYDVAATAGRYLRIPHHLWAQAAVRAYLEFSRTILPSAYGIKAIDEFQRGLQLGWQYLRDEQAVRDGYWALLEDALQHGLDNGHHGIAFILSEELLARRTHFADEAARKLEATGNALVQNAAADFDIAPRCFELAARLWARAGDDASAKRCRIARGEAIIAKTHRGGQAMLRSDWLAEGIAILRRAGADRARIIELQHELEDVKRDILEEMQHFEYRMDVRELRDHVQATVIGPGFMDALLQTAYDIAPQPSHDFVRATVFDHANRYVFQHLFAPIYYDHDANVAARHDAFDPNDEEAIYAQMVHKITESDLKLRGEVIVLQACEILFNGFHPTLNDFLELMHACPHVPEGHHLSLARGFLAGVNSEWHEAATFLIPQVEPFVRSQYHRQRKFTHVTLEDGSHRERSLHELLKGEDAETLFGKTILLDLRAILVEQTGFNLRNNWAHGRLTDNMLVGAAVFCLWWSILRLVLHPYGIEYRRRQRADQTQAVDDESPQDTR